LRHQAFVSYFRGGPLAGEYAAEMTAAGGGTLQAAHLVARADVVAGAPHFACPEARPPSRARLDAQLDTLRARFGDRVIARGMAPRPHQKDVRRDDLDSLRGEST